MQSLRRLAAAGFSATAVLAGLLGGARLLPAADWPTFRHDNERSGATGEKLTLPLAARWVYISPAPPAPAWSESEGRTIEGHRLRDRLDFDASLGITVAGGLAVLASPVDHQVRCLRVESGEEVWSFFTGAPVRLAPAISQGRVYFGSDDGRAYCLDLAGGRLLWNVRAGPADEWLLARGEMISRWPVRTGVLVDGATAYFGSGIFPHEDVQVQAVDAENGEIIWRRGDIGETDAGRNDLSPQGYLLATKDLLFVPSGRSLPAAIDRATGELVHKRVYGWRRDAGGVIGGAGALLADGQIYVAGANHALAMEEKTGDIGFGWFAGRRMAVAGESAYAATGEEILRLHREVYSAASRKRHELETRIYDQTRELQKLNATAADPKASAEKKLEDAKKAAELRERIAWAQGEVRVHARDGVLWGTPSRLDAELIVAGDLVIAGGKGAISLFRTATGAEAGKLEVDGDARQLVVAAGCLFAATSAGKVYCFGGAGAGAEGGTTPPAAEKMSFQAAACPFPEDALTATYQRAAAEILEVSGVKRGFCLIAGSERGRLAYELARRSELKIHGVEPDDSKLDEARRALAAAGLYGHRVVFHASDLAALPYADYFANLIVSDAVLLGGRLPPATTAAALARHLKPCGGTVCLGQPATAGGDAARAGDSGTWLEGMGLGEAGTITARKGWATLVRGELPGAGDWSHQYGEPGNTASSGDRLVKGGLGVLWYGDPGPGKMVNRHEGAVGPVCVHGRFFIQGDVSLLAYDAYNGLFLWERENREAPRTGVFGNESPANLAASAESVFYLAGARCIELDAVTGTLRREHALPPARSGAAYEWGFLAQEEGRLIGTATVRKRLEERLIRRGKKTQDATDALFAIDVPSGRHLWTHEGKNIEAQTIALGRGRIFFIDSSVSGEERAAILNQDKKELEKLTGEERKLAEERLKKADVRMAVALDALTGERRWAEPVDVTDCSEVGTGGGKLTVMYKDNVLILCGANANGHYWEQFLAGEFSRRRLVALSAANGYKLWARDANYRHRPVIVGDRLLAEPWSFNLQTGEQLRRDHPLTGEKTPWSIIRPGHHCGMITASAEMLFFRSGDTAYYDLDADDGTRHFAGHRLGCWINAIPAGGLVVIPEASAGCVCLFSIASTVALEPRAPRHPWSIYSSVGAVKPVKHLALNLGAPGDRRDSESGTLWLAYPRPAPRKKTGLDLGFEVDVAFAEGGEFNELGSVSAEGARVPAWVLATGARGWSRCRIPLIGEDGEPAVYSLKLHLALAGGAQGVSPAGEVRVQGKKVLDLDPLPASPAASGGARAVVAELSDVYVIRDLVIEFAPPAAPAPRDAPATHPAVLCGVELQRQEKSPPRGL